MKKYSLILTIILIITACGKYDEPCISFRTKKARICNTWVLNPKFLVKKYPPIFNIFSQDSVPDNFYSLEIKKDFTYIRRDIEPPFDGQDYEGTWGFAYDKEYIFFKKSDTSNAIYFQIIVLKNNNLVIDKYNLITKK